MIRRVFALAATIALAFACVAHLMGNEPSAELAGDVAFFVLLAALVMPPRKTEPVDRAATNSKGAR